MLADELLLFLKEFDEEALFDEFIKAFQFGTADLYLDNLSSIVGLVRYNIHNDVANILDLFIKPGYDSIKIMRYFGRRGKTKFPTLKYIKFVRGKKFSSDSNRVYHIDSLIR